MVIFFQNAHFFTLNQQKQKRPSSQTASLFIRFFNYDFNASAPPTISRISFVIAA
jgi:hypothetical protein